MSTKTNTNSEIIFSSDILTIITSHMYEDVTKLSILSQINKYIHNIIKNDIIYIEEKNYYIDYYNFLNLIKNTEMYCNSITFEEKIKKAKKIEKLIPIIQNMESNSWCIDYLDNQISELHDEFSSNKSGRWFHRKIAEYGYDHIYYIQNFVQILYQILLQISTNYILSILDKKFYNNDIHYSHIESIQDWLLEGEDLYEKENYN
jgi:hypothetical protein